MVHQPVGPVMPGDENGWVLSTREEFNYMLSTVQPDSFYSNNRTRVHNEYAAESEGFVIHNGKLHYSGGRDQLMSLQPRSVLFAEAKEKAANVVQGNAPSHDLIVA